MCVTEGNANDLTGDRLHKSMVYRWRFTILLGTLLALLLIAPVVLETLEEAAPRATALVILLMSVALCLAATFAVSGRHSTVLFVLCLAIPVVLLDLVSVFVLLARFSFIRNGVRAVFFGYVIVALLWHLFRTRQITVDTISASLCVYLVLGALWANVFAMIELAMPGSIVDSTSSAAISDEGIQSMRMLYFSYVTLSTVGYGDIVPKGTLARMCAVTEAMMGQGYLLVMVSRLVSIQVSQTMAPAEPSRN
jgi:hypothetical protein